MPVFTPIAVPFCRLSLGCSKLSLFVLAFRIKFLRSLTQPFKKTASCLLTSFSPPGQGPGHTLQNVHTTNHQSPITPPNTLPRCHPRAIPVEHKRHRPNKNQWLYYLHGKLWHEKHGKGNRVQELPGRGRGQHGAQQLAHVLHRRQAGYQLQTVHEAIIPV